MGILDRLGLGRTKLDYLSGSVHLGASPFSDSDGLSPIVLSDLFPEAAQFPVTRSAAIKVPAVSKARNLLVSSIASKPLIAMNSDGPLPSKDQPNFLYRTNGTVSPYERMVWTVDDGLFHGFAAWLVSRGAEKNGRRDILEAEWCAVKRITITDGNILVDEKEIDESEIVFFNFSSEGLLNIGNTTLQGAADQERAWVGRARNPIPLIELHGTDDSELSPDEIKDLVDAWSTARRSMNGAIGYTPPGIKIETHGEVSADLMIEGRNAVRTDVGSFVNVRASMLDGTSGIDSLTYTTKDGERNSFYEFDLPYWTDPIAHRLSQDDIVPRGTRIRFDMYEQYAPIPDRTGIPEQD